MLHFAWALQESDIKTAFEGLKKQWIQEMFMSNKGRCGTNESYYFSYNFSTTVKTKKN